MPHKIVDIIVDKISFVDRAANKFEFFIVKDEDGADEVLKDQLNEIIEKTSEEFDDIEIDNTNQAYAESVATLGKYYDDLPTDARRAMSVLTTVGNSNNTTLQKENEEEIMGEENDEEVEEQNIDIEALESKFDSYEQRISESDEKIDQLNNKVESLNEELENQKQEEEPPDPDPKELSVDDIEITDELVQRVKDEKGLYTEEEALSVADEVLDEKFNGK